MADKENKSIIKTIIDPMPGLLLDDEIDFQNINFSPNTTDNTYKLPLTVQKQLDEMVSDAIQPKIEQDVILMMILIHLCLLMNLKMTKILGSLM